MEAKLTLATIVATITLITSLFAFDARYVHAEEAKKTEIVLKAALQSNQDDIKKTQMIVKIATNNLRRQFLEDKVFELDIKQAPGKPLSPADNAMKERYLRQIVEVSSELK